MHKGSANVLNLQNCTTKEPFHLKFSKSDPGQLLWAIRGYTDSNPSKWSKMGPGFDFYKLHDFSKVELLRQTAMQMTLPEPGHEKDAKTGGCTPPTCPPSIHLAAITPTPIAPMECFLSISLLRKTFLAKVTLHGDWFCTFILHKH